MGSANGERSTRGKTLRATETDGVEKRRGERGATEGGETMHIDSAVAGAPHIRSSFSSPRANERTDERTSERTTILPFSRRIAHTVGAKNRKILKNLSLAASPRNTISSMTISSTLRNSGRSFGCEKRGTVRSEGARRPVLHI